MRRLVVAAAAGLAMALIALSLHTLSTAMEGDNAQLSRPLFASSISPPSSIAGTVFGDTNGNGKQDGGELGLSGVTVTLANTVDRVTITDSNGQYSFTVGWTDRYTVTTVTPPGYGATTSESRVVQITGPEQQVDGINFGYRSTLYLPFVARNHP